MPDATCAHLAALTCGWDGKGAYASHDVQDSLAWQEAAGEPLVLLLQPGVPVHLQGYCTLMDALRSTGKHQGMPCAGSAVHQGRALSSRQANSRARALPKSRQKVAPCCLTSASRQGSPASTSILNTLNSLSMLPTCRPAQSQWLFATCTVHAACACMGRALLTTVLMVGFLSTSTCSRGALSPAAPEIADVRSRQCRAPARSCACMAAGPL